MNPPAESLELDHQIIVAAAAAAQSGRRLYERAAGCESGKLRQANTG